MRELSFRGYLARYVKQLSYQDTNSLFKLCKEASSKNPRLREPLMLFALYSGKQAVLLRAASGLSLYDEATRIYSKYTEQTMTEMLEEHSLLLAEEYHKVWRSFQSCKNSKQADDHTKELMRKKIKRLQEKNGVSNYRIYTDLSLNPGNLNVWLKYGDSKKASLDTARAVLKYVESCPVKGVNTTVQ